MNIKLVPCHQDREFYICLAQEYVDELKQYDGTIEWEEDEVDRRIWDSEFIVDGGVLCGFICKSEVSFRGRKKLMCIEEFYVSRDERRRKVGIEAVRALVEGWYGDVCIYILNRNEVAKEFWGAVEKELGWKRIQRVEMRNIPGCEFRAYRMPVVVG